MEVSAEAKRIMVVALGKLYSSRTQRGGLQLHRSLLLTLVMKSARDIYHAAQTTAEGVAAVCELKQHPVSVEMSIEPRGAPEELQGPVSVRQEQTSPHLLPGDDENVETMCPLSPAQYTRKRRGKATVEPDFLPCKKAKLEYSPQQLAVSSVLDYVTCSGELGTPIPLQTAIAAC